MIVTCNNCTSKYQLKPPKTNKSKAHFTCRNCGNKILIDLNQHSDSVKKTTRSSSFNTKPNIRRQSEHEQIPIEEQKNDIKIGFTTKVITLMLLVSLLPGSIYFFFSTSQEKARIIEETNQNGMIVSDLLISEVNEWIDKNVRVLKVLAKSPDMMSMDGSKQKPSLVALKEEYPWIYLAFTTDRNGQNISRSDDKALKDYSNRQYVENIVLGADVAWQNVTGKTTKAAAIVLAVPIVRNGSVVGVLATAMTREAITGYVTPLKLGRTGNTLLIDQKGKTVAHRNNDAPLSQTDMSEHPLFIKAKPELTTRVEFTDSENKEIIGFTRSTKWGWVLAMHQEKDESFKTLKKARLFAYTLLSITLVAIIAIATLAGNAIVGPIRRLTAAANRISYGDLEFEIKKSSNDEIGALTDAIIRMQDSIRLSLSRIQRLKRR